MDGTRSGGRISALLNYVIIGIQFICAIIVIGLIGVRFHRMTYSTAVYLIIVSVLTLLTTLALGFLTWRPSQSRVVVLGSLVWNGIFVILWAAAAGALGTHGYTRAGGLRAALALSVIEMILFIISAVIVSFGLWRGRRATGNSKHVV